MAEIPEKTSSAVENPPAPAPAAPAAENPAEKPLPKNEPSARIPIVGKAGVIEKMRSAAARVFTEAGFEFAKGRGRPKNCPVCRNKLPEKSACRACNGTGHVPGKLDGAVSGVPPLAAPDGLPADSPMHTPVAGLAAGAGGAVADLSGVALFRRSVVASVKGALAMLGSCVGIYGRRAGCRPAFVAEKLKEAAPDEAALNDFTDSLDAVLKKRNIQPENAEEWALAVNGVRLLAPYGQLVFEFRQEVRRQAAAFDTMRDELTRELREQLRAELKAQMEAAKGGAS